MVADEIGLFSDVHGNAVAFDALLADLERHPVDRLVCLGDVLQGGPQPVECLERLRSLDCRVVMGNADWYVLTGDPGVEPETENQRLAREWSLEQLSEADREFVRSFTPTVDEPPVLAFHGSPASFEDVILPSTPEEDFRRLLGKPDAPILAGGHTHQQFVRRRGGSTVPQPGQRRALVRPCDDRGRRALRPLGGLGGRRGRTTAGSRSSSAAPRSTRGRSRPPSRPAASRTSAAPKAGVNTGETVGFPRVPFPSWSLLRRTQR